MPIPMSKISMKRRDGFEGQKLISLPGRDYSHLTDFISAINKIYITHIGYFPKAAFHYRERRNGCVDNILIYCLRGRGWYQVGNKKYEVTANQFIHLPATDQFMRYGADLEDPWTIYWVHFSGPDMEDFNKSLGITIKDGPQDIAFNEPAIKTWENMYQSLEMGYSKDNLMNANLCLHYFLATFLFPQKHIAQQQSEEQNTITNSILHMRQNLQERITVDDLAAKYHLSPSHFSSLFKKATGMSPIDYLIQLRIQKACQLLLNIQLKIKDISLAVGYDDPYYFSRLFKKLMGLSPQQYRLQRILAQ